MRPARDDGPLESSGSTDRLPGSGAAAGESSSPRKPVLAGGPVREFEGTDRFAVVRRIGIGGMGVVYQAWDRQRDMHVALKTLHAVSPEAIARLKQEFRVLTDLVHPNLVTLYELFSESERWFFTMELLSGTDFLEYVGAGEMTRETGTAWLAPTTRVSGGGAEPDECEISLTRPRVSAAGISRLLPVLGQLAEGIDFLHRAGRIHRDIKPSNVLVTAEGRLIVLDFGLATALDWQRWTPVGSSYVIGTIGYMAPEQAAGQAVTPAADWYSVGAMLYQALTGRAPFVGSSWKVLQEKQCCDPPAPSHVADGVPDDLDRLCVELLRREPALRPTAAEVRHRLLAAARISLAVPAENGGNVLSVEERSRDADSPDLPPSLTFAPFVGRDWHLRALHEALADSRQERLVAVSVHGRSGVGKSTLVSQFLEELAEHGETVVLTGRCYEREFMPFKAVDSLIDALSHYLRDLPEDEIEELVPADVRTLARLFPVLLEVETIAARTSPEFGTTDEFELRRRAFRALRDLLARLARRRPLVLWIDDLQWGDMDSAPLLAELLRPPAGLPLLFLVSYRREEAGQSPFLRSFQEERQACRGTDWRDLPVEPLSPDESRDLARRLLDPSDPETESNAARIAAEAQGNPYFVIELSRHAGRGERRPERGVSATQPTLDQILWERVLRLPDDARQLLEIVAVGGRRMPQDEAVQAAGLSGRELRVLGRLRSEQLVRTSGPQAQDAVEFYHDRIRETIVGRLRPDVLVQRHRQLAEALERAEHPDPQALAEHFRAAGEAQQASVYAALAAARAENALAFDRAAHFYRMALECGSWTATRRRDLRAALAAALANAGRGAESAPEYLALAGDASPSEALEFHRQAAEQFLQSGRFAAGIEQFRRVVESVGLKWPAAGWRGIASFLSLRLLTRLRGLRFRVRDSNDVPTGDLLRCDVCWTAAGNLAQIDHLCAMQLIARHTLLALRTGDRRRVARALVTEAYYYSVGRSKRAGRAARLIGAAETLARQSDDPRVMAEIQTVVGYATFHQGRWRQALAVLTEAEGRFRNNCTGFASEISGIHVQRLFCLFWLGEIRELTQQVPQLLKEAEERGDLFLTSYLRTAYCSLTWLVNDDADGARRQVAEALRAWPQHGFLLVHLYALISEVQIELYRGDGAAAWRRISRAWPEFAGSYQRYMAVVNDLLQTIKGQAALAAAGCGPEAKPLLRAARQAARQIAAGSMPWCAPLAAFLRAGAAAVQGERSAAASLLEDAVQGFDAADMALYASVARHRLGELRGGPEGAALRQAADEFFRREAIHNPARIVRMLAPWPDAGTMPSNHLTPRGACFRRF